MHSHSRFVHITVTFGVAEASNAAEAHMLQWEVLSVDEVHGSVLATTVWYYKQVLMYCGPIVQ